MTISLRAMSYYTTVLRHGSIAKAAGELNIAASAVSTAIDQIEAEFGLTLMTRHRSRGIHPNASGLAIARKFERLLEDYTSVLSEGADLKQSLTGTLRIGYYAPIAPAFLPGILSSFAPDPTLITLHLEECDNDSAQDGLLNGLYDAILFVSEDVRPSVGYDNLIETPAYCLLPRSHALAAQKHIAMTQIAKEPLIILNRPFASAYYRGLFDGRTDEPDIVAYASSTEMVRSLVGAECGCAILNMMPMTSTSYAGDDVVGLPISDALPPLTLAVGYEKIRPRRLVQSFVDACHAHFTAPGPAQCIVRA